MVKSQKKKNINREIECHNNNVKQFEEDLDKLFDIAQLMHSS